MKVLSHVRLFASSWAIQSKGILQARILEWVAVSFSKGSSQPGIEPRSPALRADSLPAELQGKPKNTGVGSPSLVRWIFPTQESNQGLLHCRWILYQLSHQALPTTACIFKKQDFSNFPVLEILLCLRDSQLIFSYLIIS